MSILKDRNSLWKPATSHPPTCGEGAFQLPLSPCNAGVGFSNGDERLLSPHAMEGSQLNRHRIGVILVRTTASQDLWLLFKSSSSCVDDFGAEHLTHLALSSWPSCGDEHFAQHLALTSWPSCGEHLTHLAFSSWPCRDWFESWCHVQISPSPQASRRCADEFPRPRLECWYNRAPGTIRGGRQLGGQDPTL